MCQDFIKVWSCGHEHSTQHSPCHRWQRGERFCEITDVRSTIDGKCPICREPSSTRGRSRTESAYDSTNYQASSRTGYRARTPSPSPPPRFRRYSRADTNPSSRYQYRSPSPERIPRRTSRISAFYREHLRPRSPSPSFTHRPSTRSQARDAFTAYRDPATRRSRSPYEACLSRNYRHRDSLELNSDRVRRLVRDDGDSSSDDGYGLGPVRRSRRGW